MAIMSRLKFPCIMHVIWVTTNADSSRLSFNFLAVADQDSLPLNPKPCWPSRPLLPADGADPQQASMGMFETWRFEGSTAVVSQLWPDLKAESAPGF